MKIAICPGHYVKYKGVSKNGYNEFDEVSKIVDFMTSLTGSDHELVRVDGPLSEKIKKVQDFNPDIAIEVHLGNSNNAKQGGSRAFYMINDTQSKKLATVVLKSCLETLQTENRGCLVGWYKKISPRMVKSGRCPDGWKAKMDLFLEKTKCPSILIEPFYLSSPKDCYIFIDSEYPRIAEAILRGIDNYFRE